MLNDRIALTVLLVLKFLSSYYGRDVFSTNTFACDSVPAELSFYAFVFCKSFHF